MKKLLTLLFLCAGFAVAQNPNPIQPTTTAPSGSCGSSNVKLLTPNGTIYTCQSGMWAPVSGGGGSGCVPVGTANKILVSDGAGGCTEATPTISGSTITASLTGAASLNLLKSNNLSDLVSAATARTNLGLSALATTVPGTGVATALTNATDTSGGVCTVGGGGCPGGSGTVTVVGGGSLTSTALVTGGGTTTIQTPSATATMDSSGNISTPGSVTTGAGTGAAGFVDMGPGTAHTATGVGFQAPTSVTTPFMMTLPALPATGFLLNTGTTDPSAISYVASTGTGNVVLATSPTLVTPILGTPTTLTLTNATGLPLAGITSQAANTVAMNATGGSAALTAVSMPTCTTGADLYNTSTHTWSCVTTGSGTRVLLESHTASTSASIDFLTRNAAGQSGASIQSDYTEYEILIQNLVPATTNTILNFRVSTDDSTFDSGNNYSWSRWGYNSGGGGQGGGVAQSAITIQTALSNSANLGLSGTYHFSNPGSASHFKNMYGQCSYLDQGGLYAGGINSGAYISNTAVQGFQFLMSSGNVTSGKVFLYGIQ